MHVTHREIAIIILLMLQLTTKMQFVSGFSCYQCTSIKQNKACDDPLHHPHEINATYCQPGMLWSPVINDAMPGFVSSIINTISTAVSSFNTPKDIKMLCIKAKVEDVKRGIITLRLCTYLDNAEIRNVNANSKETYITKKACKDLPTMDRKVLSCNVCDTEGCNSASRDQIKFYFISFFFVLVWIL